VRRTRLLLLTLFSLAASTAAGRLSSPDVVVIAHRGASFEAPEHTFAAWDLALGQGADWIEQDLQLTKDGVLVVLHDDSLDRTAKGPAVHCTGHVREKTWAELQRCEVGSWFADSFPVRARPSYAGERIPSLEQVLSRYAARADVRFYIETKSPDEAPGMEKALLAALRRHRLAGPGADTGRVIVQSFSFASLERMYSLDPAVPLVALIDDPIAPDSLEPTLRRIAAIAKGIGPARRIVSARMVGAAHAAGLFVHPYTVNDPAVMRHLLGLGVDGMFTDRPALLRDVIRDVIAGR
jgi:glycerophosphoryl diester phosphodiesterase